MQHVFWLREGQLAGRTGPNKDPWYPERLAAQGIAAVLSVNDGESVYAEDLQSCGIDYQQVSLSPNAPPRPGDHETCINALPHAYDFVMRTISTGRPALVHCTSGKDRTGMFMAYYLCRREGLAPKLAISEVKQVRPIALSAEGWEPFTLDVLSTLHGEAP